MTCGIYKITERETERCYIGQSKNIEARWKYHQGPRGKFPIELFNYEILVTAQLKDLNELEILMIETFDSHRNGFNKTIGGTSIKATHPDEETRRKISKAVKGGTTSMKGRKLGAYSDERRIAATIATKKAMQKLEIKQKISAAKKGKTPHNKGKKDKTFQCPHCGKICNLGNLRRWHLDNCREV